LDESERLWLWLELGEGEPAELDWDEELLELDWDCELLWLDCEEDELEELGGGIAVLLLDDELDEDEQAVNTTPTHPSKTALESHLNRLSVFISRFPALTKG
jgi:hypothetical protein